MGLLWLVREDFGVTDSRLRVRGISYVVVVAFDAMACVCACVHDAVMPVVVASVRASERLARWACQNMRRPRVAGCERQHFITNQFRLCQSH